MQHRNFPVLRAGSGAGTPPPRRRRAGRRRTHRPGPNSMTGKSPPRPSPWPATRSRGRTRTAAAEEVLVVAGEEGAVRDPVHAKRLAVCFTNAATSPPPPATARSRAAGSRTTRGLGPAPRFDALPSAPMVPFTMRRRGNRRCSMAATSAERSPEAHSRTSASGMCFSISASTPGVCAMSPMFTTCHDERSRMRGGRPEVDGAPRLEGCRSLQNQLRITSSRRGAESASSLIIRKRRPSGETL
jgi:hypothetical protein